MSDRPLFRLLTAFAGTLLCASSALAFDAIGLKATDFLLATGNPSLVPWKRGTVQVPVWSLSGKTVGQSVVATTPPLPEGCAAVRVEILVAAQDESAPDSATAVFRAHLAQLSDGQPIDAGATTGSKVPFVLSNRPDRCRTVVLESCRRVRPGQPLVVRIQREPGDPADAFDRPLGLISAVVRPLAAPPAVRIVESSPGYNSWPMIQAIGNRLVCAYSRGSGHSIGEGKRGVFARTSDDGGETWSDERPVATDPTCGEVTIGKGVDADGAMLLWVRCLGGKTPHHDLYRTADGLRFEKVASPSFDPFPMQVTDVFRTDEGLVSLWFATNYKTADRNAWGTLVSVDNGRTWEQRVVARGMETCDLPTEQSVVNLGNGRLLMIARRDGATPEKYVQHQLTSVDGGRTWTHADTNIGDVRSSTPSLVYDAATGLVSNYYYERGRGVLKRRVAKADFIFGRPLEWPAAEPVAFGDEERPHDAGNVNATVIGDRHYLSFYFGTRSQTSVCVQPCARP